MDIVILQSTQYTCGPCAIVNALAALGVEESERELMRMAEACPVEGTNARKMLRTLRWLGYTPVSLSPKGRGRGAGQDRHSVAWQALRDALASGYPAVLSVDRDEHWVAAVGVVGERVLVADSARGELVLSYDRQTLMARWRGKSSARPYYGVIVTKGET
jgi:predicted double-glycine peptidase